MLDAMFDTKFDTDEYLHLALHANSVRNHHACMAYLKELLAREPRHAKAIYLLAAQHAELGLHERAIAGMRAALALEPAIEMARLQLGLLLLDRIELPKQESPLQYSITLRTRRCKNVAGR